MMKDNYEIVKTLEHNLGKISNGKPEFRVFLDEVDRRVRTIIEENEKMFSEIDRWAPYTKSGIKELNEARDKNTLAFRELLRTLEELKAKIDKEDTTEQSRA
jgi:hypothetical protein